MGTGLSKHFTQKGGCPNNVGKSKDTLNYTLIDYYDTTSESLEKSNHVKGACRCAECLKLKDIEDKWILKLGTFFGESGLNSRDEIQSKTRCRWSKTCLNTARCH